MRKVLGIAASVFAIFFSVPTGLILASWNALPGDSLYTTKRAMENVALVVVRRTPLASNFSVSFTDRRFKEADKLLATKGSTVGYSLLVEQAQQSKDIIVDQKNTQQADQLIQNIDEYEKLIEAKKTAVAAQAQQYVAQAPTYTQPSQTTTQQPTYTNPSAPTQAPQTVITVPAQTQTTMPSPGQTTQPQIQQPPAQTTVTQQPAQLPPQNQQQVQQTLAQLDNAQQHLERIKNEIKRELPSHDEDRGRNQPSSENSPQKGDNKGRD